MTLAAKIALVPPLLLSLLMGLTMLFAPDLAAEGLGGFNGATELGAATLRADLSAFFLTSAIAILGALFAGKREWLWVPVALYGLAAFGRIIDVLFTGLGAGELQPIVVEILVVILVLFARGSRRS